MRRGGEGWVYLGHHGGGSLEFPVTEQALCLLPHRYYHLVQAPR